MSLPTTSRTRLLAITAAAALLASACGSGSDAANELAASKLPGAELIDPEVTAAAIGCDDPAAVFDQPEDGSIDHAGLRFYVESDEWYTVRTADLQVRSRVVEEDIVGWDYELVTKDGAFALRDSYQEAVSRIAVLVDELVVAVVRDHAMSISYHDPSGQVVFVGDCGLTPLLDEFVQVVNDSSFVEDDVTAVDVMRDLMTGTSSRAAAALRGDLGAAALPAWDERAIDSRTLDIEDAPSDVFKSLVLTPVVYQLAEGVTVADPAEIGVLCILTDLGWASPCTGGEVILGADHGLHRVDLRLPPETALEVRLGQSGESLANYDPTQHDKADFRAGESKGSLQALDDTAVVWITVGAVDRAEGAVQRIETLTARAALERARSLVPEGVEISDAGFLIAEGVASSEDE